MSLDNQNKEVDNLADVDLAQNVAGTSHIFIEGASKISVIISYIMLAAFFLMHLYACIKTPPTLALKDEFFKLNSTQENVSMDIDITLSQLQILHRFVDVNGTFVRTDLSASRSLPIEFTSRISYLKNYNVVNTENIDKQSMTINFENTGNTSTMFPIFHKTIGDFDTIKLDMTITTNYQNIDGFRFFWAFSNPSAEKYNRSSKLLMSFLIGYMLVVFVFYLKFDVDIYTQIFCVILGIAGIFSSNPISLLFKESTGIRVADYVLMAIFTNIYKVFVIIQLELLRAHITRPNTTYTIILAAIFGLVATVETAATYDRADLMSTAQTENFVILTTEKAMIAFNLLYAIGIAAFFVYTVIQNAGSNPRRIEFFGVVVATTSLVMLYSGVYCPLTGTFMYTIRPSLLYISVCITNAAFSLFLLHPGSQLGYNKMDDVKNDTQPMILDAEQMADDTDDNDDDEDEDEDEEEEEEEEEEE